MKATQAPNSHATPVETLRRIFLERKERNPAYSTRSFARDIGMSQSLLSLVLNRKRPLTIKQATQIAMFLDFSNEETEAFLQSTLMELPERSRSARKLKRLAETRLKATGASFETFEVDRFKAISQWYHVAILDLSTTRAFRSDNGWIARKLGISPIEAADAVERLLKLGLLEKQGTRLRKTREKIYVATQNSEQAVRNFHRQMIQLAQKQLDRASPTDFARREISSMTMAIPRSKWPLARKRIQKFQREVAAELTGSADCDEVYQLNVQMFPLTTAEEEA